MGLETGVTYIEDLVDTNPVGATDNIDEGDDHIRNIKTAVQGSFPNLGAAAVTKTAAQINDLASKTGTETLTNKTLTSPVINEVLDANSNELLTFGTTASAVNNLRIANTATGNPPQLRAQGEANIGFTLLDSNGNELFKMSSVAAAVNFITLLNSATGNTVSLTAAGTDTNIDLNISGKGSGTVTLPADCITATQIATDAVGSAEIAAQSVTFNSEIDAVATNYDFIFSDTATETVPAGVYSYGKDMPTSGSMNGTLALQVKVDAVWYDMFSVTVTNGAAAIPTGQVTSNGNDVQWSFTYGTGIKAGITARMTKIFA